MFVILKILNNPSSITLEFVEFKKKIAVSHKYAKNGSLRTCLNTNYNKIGWYNKIKNLYDIVSGLESIHQNDLIHRDLHAGNILMNENRMYITDMGLCRPASENIKNNVYGVLCYMAPETLQKHNYTKASDIYSFDANQLNRPTAKEIKEILAQWCCEVFNNQTELGKQIIEAEEINNNLPVNSTPSISLGLSYTMHSKAIYTSKLLNFNNLSKPKNTDDYYEQNDNIISLKSLASLQIDISKLNINDLLKPKKS
ncbi:kinase-like domain-containing protein [Rhizophagus irregularis DAOM 181602=DAOM 197198]|nr:kinase-like domain-containing protein [Rhizophagus irregularis DAOM 181602=DAOM 197198]